MTDVILKKQVLLRWVALLTASSSAWCAQDRKRESAHVGEEGNDHGWMDGWMDEWMQSVCC